MVLGFRIESFERHAVAKKSTINYKLCMHEEKEIVTYHSNYAAYFELAGLSDHNIIVNTLYMHSEVDYLLLI